MLKTDYFDLDLGSDMPQSVSLPGYKCDKDFDRIEMAPSWMQHFEDFDYDGICYIFRLDLDALRLVSCEMDFKLLIDMLEARLKPRPICDMSITLGDVAVVQLNRLCDLYPGKITALNLYSDKNYGSEANQIVLREFPWSRLERLEYLRLLVRCSPDTDDDCHNALCQHHHGEGENSFEQDRPGWKACLNSFHAPRLQIPVLDSPLNLEYFELCIQCTAHRVEGEPFNSRVLPLVRDLAGCMLAIGGTACEFHVTFHPWPVNELDPWDRAQEWLYNEAFVREIDAQIEDQALPRGWSKLPKRTEGAGSDMK